MLNLDTLNFYSRVHEGDNFCSANDWVKKCTRMNVTRVVDRGAPRKMWRSCVKKDMKDMGIKEEMAQDRCAWRNITRGQTHASTDA